MQSESIGDLVEALCKAQGEFTAATKDATNPHFRSKYADLETVVAATAPALRKHGLSVVQMFSGNSLTTMLAHKSGEWISGMQDLVPTKNDPQGIASASTYARRYGWMAIVGIAPEDDDGNGANRPNDAAPHTQPEAPHVDPAVGAIITKAPTKVERIEKDGKKPFFVIHFGQSKASTFSETYAKSAQYAIDNGCACRFTIIKNGNFSNIDHLEVAQ